MNSGSVPNSEQKLKYEKMLENLKMSDVKCSHLKLMDTKLEMKDSVKEKQEDSILLDGLRIKQNEASTCNQNSNSFAARTAESKPKEVPQF